MTHSNKLSLHQHTTKPAAGHSNCIHLVHSKQVSSVKLLNPHQRESIAARCLVFNASRSTVAREYGIERRDVDDICDRAMFERGVQAGRNAERFSPVDSPRTGRRAA